ncbi:MAG: 23S rRNA (uracil(1939)-C(5))-methyltransferase RlmD [Firmicutes bacterium HGW-Firmicutes-9]|nr:MAG: 23S rRNA (uracil(1939)-C(5))-methyltransferase RlmD [Firmicutes bacterium HGW-Firmicutes-9]
MRPPVEKNDDLVVIIESLTNEGQGVARVEGFAVFVVGALAGEEVKAHVIKVQPTYAIAKAVEIIKPSPDRVRPACPVFSQCGGCTLWHLSYPAQLRQKQQFVLDALTRLGGFTSVPMQPIVGMEDPTRYRNKGSFPFSVLGNAAVFGFYAERSHRLVPFSDCLIQDERIVDAARRVAAWANTCGVPVYDETTGEGQLRHVVARTTAEGELMVTVVTKGQLKKKDDLLSFLENCDSVWHNENPKLTNVVFGEKFTLLAGRSALTETIGGKRFSVSPQSFLQVNRVQTQVLYDTAREFLAAKDNETVVDGYCGVGTISLFIAEDCKRVIGIEQVAPAIEDAKANATANGVKNAEFICGNVEDVLPRLFSREGGVDAIVLDPPRKGCEEAALEAIAKSTAKRVVYVSCNPATLARDCKYLAAHGFTLSAVRPVDMFPQTCHVESVVLMEREIT